jgi:hypothetical protein
VLVGRERPPYDTGMPEVFFDSDDDAAELISALEGEGYTTTLGREAFAGEEDWDDRAWVLVVEPFDDRVVEMVDVYGGWMPGEERPVHEPPPLPGQPKRLKG